VELDDLLSQAVGKQGSGRVVGEVTASSPTALPARAPPAPYSPPPRHASGSNAGIGEVSYKHDAIIDLILANPFIQQNELARISGYTTGWLSQILSSDAFQVRLAERAGDTQVSLRRDRDAMFKALLDRSYEVLSEKMALPATTISDQLAIRTLELSSRAVGYGARDPAVLIQNNVTSVEVHLEKMGEGLTKLLRKRRGELIEQQPTDE
jgi:hypothetical protein